MSIYTNYSNSYYSSTNYTDVEPFVGENFNYHELGIIAASEIAANHNTFMKSIALSELAAFEQTGSTDVLYESVNFRGIFEKIKMFFKKIIEKIHKIFHTFIAKMSSWFGNNATFAKNYEKEVVKKWANVKNDWEFKGYKFTNVFGDTASTGAEEFKVDISTLSQATRELCTGKIFLSALADFKGTNVENWKKQLADDREHLDDAKDNIRACIVATIDAIGSIPTTINDAKAKSQSVKSSLDSSEYTEELFKVFRNGEDSKEDISKDDIPKIYGGSIGGMMTYIKEFDKTKRKTEAAEKKITGAIDKLIKDIDKAQNDLLKDNKASTATKEEKEKNELIVQASAMYQSIFGFMSECLTQAFSAFLQAQKDACAQAKEIAVKVIGQSKKMTESVDYSDNSGFDFISSVKLI